MQEDYKRIRLVVEYWGDCDKRISELMTKKKLAEFRIKDMYNIGGTQKLDGMPHSTTVSSPVENEVERMKELRLLFQEEIDLCVHQIEELQRFKLAVDNVINTMRYRERTVIKLRYQDHRQWQDIARHLDISLRMVYYMEERALRYLSPRIRVSVPK